VSRPGNDRIQLALFADYATNLPQYPEQAYARHPGAAHNGPGQLARCPPVRSR
jgi:hypothetical protein